MLSFNCKSIKRSFDCVRDLCNNADIVALQETWLLPYDLDIINSTHSDFGSAATSSVDLSAGVLRGRPYGGLAIMWKKTRFTNVSVINCFNDRIMAISVKLGLRSFLIFNVYMPTDEIENLPEFTNCLARISAIVEECNEASVYILGDFNAHPRARFGTELKNFCDEQEWLWADITKLGGNSDTFTFISESHGSHRWLDHCLATEAAWKSILSVDVMYDISWSDHFPLRVECNIETTECLTLDDGIVTGTGIRWGDRDATQIDKYYIYCEDRLRTICDKIICNDCDNSIRCKNLDSHFLFINNLYKEIVDIMQCGAKRSAKRRQLDNVKRKQVTGWNFHVQESHSRYRLYFEAWVVANKPSTGNIYDNMIKSRKIFKNKLRWCQRNEEAIKLDILAMYRKQKNFVKFWKQTKAFNCKQNKPSTVDGLQCHEQIANMFAERFKIQSLPIDPVLIGDDNDHSLSNSKEHNIQFTVADVIKILKQMNRGKSPGYDELSIEHILYGGPRLHEKLCGLYNLCMKYSYLPHDLMKTVVVPIVKNKTGDLGSAANYRPISLGTVIGKILERLIQPELLRNVVIDDAQFGFRTGLSTDSAIIGLKHTIQYYTSRDTSIYACFLDLSRAFDLVNYDILWEKLYRSQVPIEIVELLRHWYGNQTNTVKWGEATSNSYTLDCGVRQGGITSPDLFNIYVNNLIEELRDTNVGCHINGVCVNSLSYADDMVVLSPSIKGLRKLISVCEHYANAHGLKYNVDKTEMLVFKAGKGPERIPEVILNGKVVRVVQKFKYLGHILSEYLKDDSDIERERRALSVRCNMLARRFGKCSKEVKITLFNAYCQCLYTCQLWTNFLKKSLTAIRVQYNDAFRILMGLPRYCSASTMFAESRVPDFYCIVRARVASFWERLRRSNNGILKVVCEGMPSPIINYWLSVHRNKNKK